MEVDLMAMLVCRLKSMVLQKSVSVHVAMQEKSDCPRKVLYLLHGLSDDDSVWSRNANVERYAAPYPLLVVMPDVERSFYTDMAYGGKFYTYLTQELPEWIENMFCVSAKREDTFLAGLSMGGYGAVKIALRNPERYAGAASLSGVLDIKKCVEDQNLSCLNEFEAIFGKHYDLTNSMENPMFLLDQIGPVKPKILQYCGTEDYLYDCNQTFRKKIEGLGFDYTYHEESGGHEWNFWDRNIKRAIDEFFGTT